MPEKGARAIGSDWSMVAATNLPWRIELLGRIRVSSPGCTITRFNTRKTASLLAYLACHPDRCFPRDALVEFLWPEDDPECGRRSLRVALSSLRRQLEPPGVLAGTVLVADRATVGLRWGAAETDVQEFETALRAATREAPEARVQCLTRAIELYGGDFAADCAEEWFEAERRRLREQYLLALDSLTECLADAGAAESALDCARQACAADPFRERSRRNLIQAYAVLGQVAEACREYEEFRGLIQRELGVAPSVATRQLLERVRDPKSWPRAGAPGSPAVPAPSYRETRPERVSPERPLGDRAAPAARGGSLPPEFNRFVGRADAIDAIADMFRSDHGRLVTLTGPGGIGKTRLALAVARQLREELPVWFVSLAELADPELLAETILGSVRPQHDEGIAALAHLEDVLSREPSLLVLDNLEQLAEASAGLVSHLLIHIGSLRCLVTSRKLLGLSYEREFRVQPLAIPGVKNQLPAGRRPERLSPERVAELAGYETVQLFVDRAQVVRPDFQITPANASAVAELSARLEGIPLAVELAAARMRMLTPRQMLDQLDQRFELLASSRKDLPARHRTLRASIDWSFQSLSPASGSIFTRLAIFRGGCVLSAVIAVLSDLEVGSEQTESFALLRGLEELQECSLLIVEQDPIGEMRYRQLETLREYAADQLAPEDAEVLCKRHAEYYLRFLEQRIPQLRTDGETRSLAEIEPELENLRAAVEWAARENRHALRARLASALTQYLRRRGTLVEALRVAEIGLKALRDISEGTHVQADLLRERAAIYLDQFRWQEAERDATEALRLAQETGAIQLAAHASNLRGLAARGQRDYSRARELLGSALETFQKADDPVGAAMALDNLGLVEDEDPAGSKEQAASYLTRALAMAKNTSCSRVQAEILTNLGVLEQERGALATANRYYQEALELELGLRDQLGTARLLCNLAELALTVGRRPHAERLLIGSLELFDRLGSPYRSYAERLLADARHSTEAKATVGIPEEVRRGSVEQIAAWARGGEAEPS